MHRKVEKKTKVAAMVKNDTNLNFQFLRGIRGFSLKIRRGFQIRFNVFALRSKASAIEKRETNLKGGVFVTLFMPTFLLQMMFLATRKHIL